MTTTGIKSAVGESNLLFLVEQETLAQTWLRLGTVTLNPYYIHMKAGAQDGLRPIVRNPHTIPDSEMPPNPFIQKVD